MTQIYQHLVAKEWGDLGAYLASAMEEVLVWGSAELSSHREDGLGHCTGSVRIKPFRDQWCGNSDCSPEHLVKRQNTCKSDTHLTCARKKSTVSLQDKNKIYFPICRGCEQRRGYLRVLPSCRSHNGQKRLSPVLVCNPQSEGHLSRQLIFLGDK